MTITIGITRIDNEGGTYTQEVELTVSEYRGTTHPSGDDPDSSEIVSAHIGNRDVTNALRMLVDLEDLRNTLEL
jgi:hypothetical protein